MRRYWQRDVYLCLAKRGPMSVVDLTRQLGMPYRTGTHHPTKVGAQVVFKMRLAGLLEAAANGKWKIVAGTMAPDDKRGCAPASLAALAKYSRHNIVNLRAKHGHHIKPIAATAIEQAWGWMPPLEVVS